MRNRVNSFSKIEVNYICGESIYLFMMKSYKSTQKNTKKNKNKTIVNIQTPAFQNTSRSLLRLRINLCCVWK